MAGRPGEDPATALREHLIEVAERLLTERQVSAITTRDLARTARVSEGVIYNYFADKNELLLTALVRRFHQGVARYEADLPVPGTATVEENLHACARAVLHLGHQALPAVAGLINDPALLHRFFAEVHQGPHHPHVYQRRVAEYVAAEQRLGRVRGDVEAPAVALLLIGGATMLMLSHMMSPAPATTGTTPAPTAPSTGSTAPSAGPAGPAERTGGPGGVETAAPGAGAAALEAELSGVVKTLAAGLAPTPVRAPGRHPDG